MSHNTDHLPTQQQILISPFKKVQYWGPLIVALCALIAFILWTLPNWTLFIQNVAQFGTLWQIEGNRRAIIILSIKFFSPLLVAFIVAASIWLWYLLEPLLHDDDPPLVPLLHDENPPLVPQNYHETLHSVTTPQHQNSCWSLPSQPGDQTGTAENCHLQDHEQPSPCEEPAASQPQPTASPVLQDEHNQGEEGVTPMPTQPVADPYHVSITLLKRVSMTVHAQGKSASVPLTPTAKRVHLLAYIAWLRGGSVNRDKMLEQVFGHGKSDEEATRDSLDQAFDSHKKFIRADLRKTIVALNNEIGQKVIPENLDIFSHKHRLYWLSKVCTVTDIEAIEQYYHIIEQARTDGLLVDSIPETVKNACDKLIAAYTGDFLQELVVDYLDDLEPWVSSWARKPYTHYRDYYLQALWYAAEYEVKKGQRYADDRLNDEGEANRKAQRKHWQQAAQFYRTYAMYACNSRFDLKVAFGSGSGREQGERVIMSERALRRCLVLYGATEAPHLVDQVYAAYVKQMRAISAKAWEPRPETREDYQNAKQATSAYRFSKQVMSHEPPLETTA